jgi:hypothetical protein
MINEDGDMLLIAVLMSSDLDIIDVNLLLLKLIKTIDILILEKFC